jgi:hypothetical protein
MPEEPIVSTGSTDPTTTTTKPADRDPILDQNPDLGAAEKQQEQREKDSQGQK